MPKEIRITMPLARKVLKEEIVNTDARRAHIHSGLCEYWSETSKRPKCLIGRLLHKLGVKPAVLRKLDGSLIDYSATISSNTALSILRENGVVFTQAGLDYCADVQDNNDERKPWGECI